MRIGELIRTERLKLGWEAKELAERANVSAATISRIERGENMARGDTLSRIGKVLGIDPARLQRAARDEEEEAEENETQYVDLAGLSPEARERTKRMIDLIVREAKREAEEMRKRKPTPGSDEGNNRE